MITKEDLKLEMTCQACPEQYDVIYNRHPIGYLRYRHGSFSCHPYIDDDEINWSVLIYHWSNGGEMDGILDDDEQYVIDEALDALCKYYNEGGGGNIHED